MSGIPTYRDCMWSTHFRCSGTKSNMKTLYRSTLLQGMKCPHQWVISLMSHHSPYELTLEPSATSKPMPTPSIQGSPHMLVPVKILSRESLKSTIPYGLLVISASPCTQRSAMVILAAPHFFATTQYLVCSPKVTDFGPDEPESITVSDERSGIPTNFIPFRRPLHPASQPIT